MKIKKNAEAPKVKMTGGAAIADRFKLSAPEAKAERTVNGKAVAWAFSMACLALLLSGALAALLWKHWEFLMPT